MHAETAQAIFFDLVRKYREHKRTLIICTRTISRSFLSKFHFVLFHLFYQWVLLPEVPLTVAVLCSKLLERSLND